MDAETIKKLREKAELVTPGLWFIADPAVILSLLDALDTQSSRTGTDENVRRAADALLGTLWQLAYSGIRTHEENWSEMDRRFPQARWLHNALKEPLSTPNPGDGWGGTDNAAPGTEKHALQRALDFIEGLTADPLLMGDDIEMTLDDVQSHARIELDSIIRQRFALLAPHASSLREGEK